MQVVAVVNYFLNSCGCYIGSLIRFILMVHIFQAVWNFIKRNDGKMTIFALLMMIANYFSGCNTNETINTSKKQHKCTKVIIEHLKYQNQNGFLYSGTPDYFGEQCQTKNPVSLKSRIISLFSFGNSDLSRGKPTIYPFASRSQLETVYAFHQSAVKRLLMNGFAGADNDGYAARILPPNYPLECCAFYDGNLPPLKKLYNDIFKQKPGQFIPDPNNRNLLYNAFYQYFVLQFFDADSNLSVTASQLYGSDPVSERSMRSFSGGKLKTLKRKHNHYAPNARFALRSNLYLNTVQSKRSFKDTDWLITILSKIFVQLFKRTEILSTSPMLYVLSTLWVREHNRVCDELSRKWPSWTDEELYTTAKKIVTGQMMTIMMDEILNVELRPELYHHRMENIHGSGTPIELYLTMAVSSLPEKRRPKLTSFSQVLEDGLKNALKFMVNSKTGMVTAHNVGALTEQLTKTLMTLSREHCLQGFNDYRIRLGMPAYKSFFDLTGNNETATELKKLYGTVKKVELLTGLLTEKFSSGTLTTAEVLTNSFIINAVLTNNLTSKHSWVSGTFGGVEFFDLVKSTRLKSLVSRNLYMHFDEFQVDLYAK